MTRQTREEKNKVARDNRAAKWFNTYTNYKATIIYLFQQCEEHHHTHDWLLIVREQRILNYWGKWPNWVRDKLDGVWDACHDILWAKLTICYRHPDTGVLWEAKDLLQDGFGSRLTDCYMCWLTEDGFVPFCGGPKETKDEIR